MKRRLIKCGVFALAGAIINIAHLPLLPGVGEGRGEGMRASK